MVKFFKCNSRIRCLYEKKITLYCDNKKVIKLKENLFAKTNSDASQHLNNANKVYFCFII